MLNSFKILLKKTFTLKYLRCPACNEEPIAYIRLFWLAGPYKTYECKNCKKNIKVDFSYIIEFFLYFFIMAIFLNVIEHLLKFNLSNWIAFLVIIISFFILNFKEKFLFKLV